MNNMAYDEMTRPTMVAAEPKETIVRSRSEGERVTLDLSPKLQAMLNELVTDTGRTKADVLRKGLYLYHVLYKENEAGRQISIGDGTGETGVRIVGLDI